MGRDGVTLVGRVDGADGSRVSFSPGVGQALAAADRFFVEQFVDDIETIIRFTGIDVPEAEPEEVVNFEPPETSELDLEAEGIGTVLWTCGYRLGFNRWIDLPIFDDFGFPIASNGITDQPGLGFLGVPWQKDQASANLLGITRDAEYLAERLS
jgi:putative flavoprotein involved in K+ transport